MKELHGREPLKICALFDFNIYEASLLLSRVFQSGVYDLEVGVQVDQAIHRYWGDRGYNVDSGTCGFV